MIARHENDVLEAIGQNGERIGDAVGGGNVTRQHQDVRGVVAQSLDEASTAIAVEFGVHVGKHTNQSSPPKLSQFVFPAKYRALSGETAQARRNAIPRVAGRLAPLRSCPSAVMDWLYTCSGFLVGTLVGATGVGGGSLMTPILVMLFGVPAGTAVGTDLIFASITKGVGTALHGFNRSVNWRIVAALCAGSLPASLFALWLLHSVLDRDAVAPFIKHALGIALVITSCALFVQGLRKPQKPGEQRRRRRTRRAAPDEEPRAHRQAPRSGRSAWAHCSVRS